MILRKCARTAEGSAALLCNIKAARIIPLIVFIYLGAVCDRAYSLSEHNQEITDNATA